MQDTHVSRETSPSIPVKHSMHITSKLPSVGTTIFTTMSQLALDYQAINLGQGFPDFNPDPALLQLVTDAMAQGHNQYPAMAGVPALRAAIAEKVQALYGHRYNPESEITVTSGATEALMSSIQALTQAGDEVIVLEPCYDAYIPAITLAGAKPVVVPMTPPNQDAAHYAIDWNRVQAAITPATRAMVLNFPHNPTGILCTENDLDALERITQNTDIILISDEVYEHIVLHGQQHLSLARRASLAARSVVISSFGKTYHATGWKIGYCCAPAMLMREIRKVHQFMVFTVPSPMQVALAEFMQRQDAYLNLSTFYQEKYDLLHHGLATTRFRPLESAGSFFLIADYSQISTLPETEFAHWLTREHKVTTIPMSAFYQDPEAPQSNHRLVRFCFAKENQTLKDAIARLRQV